MSNKSPAKHRRRKNTGTFDEIDNKIIALLRVDGRHTVAHIASVVGISESATRARVKRLMNDEVLQIVAITNPSKLGLTVDVFITLQTEPAKTMSVARALSKLDDVRYVGILSGQYDLVVSSAFRDDEEFLEFLHEKVAKIPGVVRTETFRILKTMKRTYDRVWPMLPED